jgi:LuxR family maltose regulon positive regulatory protein
MPPRRRPSSPGDNARVERTRLLTLLEESGPAAVTVISAPAGGGKSTLAAQWLAVDQRPNATLRLAAYMDDAVVLAAALVDVLEVVGPAAPAMRTTITAAEPGFSAALLPGLTRLAGERGVPYLLVIDDVHLGRSKEARQVLAAVCEGVPDGSTVALLTRDRTPDWLARARASGRLAELTSSDLAFDVREGATLLRAAGLDLGDPEVAAIVEHTEGWAVGIYLTALAMSAQAVSPRAGEMPPALGSGRFLTDYLSSEVLGSLDADRQQFMMRTSILEELTGPLCDAVLERHDSAAVLADLHRTLQLVMTVDGDAHRFRYHQLLAEALSSDLLTQEPGEIPLLHERAARWFAAHDDRNAAIRHATAAGRTDLVSQLVWPEVARCVGSGRIGLLHSWLAGLSEAQISGDRWLCLAAAWLALQEGDSGTMVRWSLAAEGHAGREWRRASRTDGYAASLAVLHALIGGAGLEDTRELCEGALMGLALDDGFRPPAAFLHGVVLTLQRDVDGGRSSLMEADRLAQALRVPVIEADAKSSLGMLAIEEGDRVQGIRLVSEAADVIQANHLERLATTTHGMTAQALVLALRGDQAAASAALATARRLNGLVEDIAPWFAVTGRLLQARTAILLGDGATARLLISEARRYMTPDLRMSSADDRMKEAEEALARLSAGGVVTRPLTAAELRVLQFLPSHLTLPQIGEHLFLAQATIKTHTLSIYRKFGVSSRGEAVARARMLGLLEDPLGD